MQTKASDLASPDWTNIKTVFSWPIMMTNLPREKLRIANNCNVSVCFIYDSINLTNKKLCEFNFVIHILSHEKLTFLTTFETLLFWLTNFKGGFWAVISKIIIQNTTASEVIADINPFCCIGSLNRSHLVTSCQCMQIHAYSPLNVECILVGACL